MDYGSWFCAAKKAKLSGLFNGSFTESQLSLGGTRRRLIEFGTRPNRGAGWIIQTLSLGVKKPAPIVYRSRWKSITQISEIFEESPNDWSKLYKAGFYRQVIQ